MVNFNNESTISTPAVDIVRILILEARVNVLEAIEKGNRLEFSNADDLLTVSARLMTLYYNIEGTILRRIKTPKEKEELIKNITSTDKKKVLEAFVKINLLLDELKLTRIDGKVVYDSTRVETENTAKDL